MRGRIHRHKPRTRQHRQRRILRVTGVLRRATTPVEDRSSPVFDALDECAGTAKAHVRADPWTAIGLGPRIDFRVDFRVVGQAAFPVDPPRFPRAHGRMPTTATCRSDRPPDERTGCVSAQRADLRYGDALGRNPRGPRLLGQDPSHIYGCGVRRDLQAECPEHLGSHLITLSADGRPQMNEKASRISPPPLAEESDAA